MAPRSTGLRLYGAPSDAAPLAWEWVDAALVDAPVYWVVVPGPGHPHPRPVWGVWAGERLHLSIGSPHLASRLEVGGVVTVHLGGDVDVVLVEGLVRDRRTDAAALAAYNRKYDWDYAPAEYGDLLVVEPGRVLAWRSTGFAGRDGFRETGGWSFDAQDRTSAG